MSTKPTASIYDVAKAAGVSPGTVSRVLNRRGSFSEATRSVVLEAARGMQFRSRVAARKVTIAIVTDKARYATFGGFLSCLHTHLTEELAKEDVAIQLFTEANLDRLGEHAVDGVISISWDPNTIRRLKAMHRKSGVPVLIFNRSGIPGFSVVESDFVGGGRTVGEYLLGQGHQRIAYVIEDHTPGLDRRLEGLVQALADHGLAYDSALVCLTRHSRTEDALKRVMALKPTAVFVGSEDLVLEVLSILRDGLGLDVPQDIALVGMENVHVNRFTSPPITSLRQPFEEMAAEAMNAVMRLIRGEGEPKHCILKNDWIERLSVAQNIP